MQVAELTAPRTLRVVDATVSDPAPGEVQVRVEAVGVCGSDLHSYNEGAVGDTPCIFPMVLGHEPSGVVLKTGPGVTGWQPGDRAALEPAIYCYHCEFCHSGRHNICANLRFMSNPGEPGFFRQVANLPAANLLGIPPALSFSQASLIEPLAVVLHSMKFADLHVGETAVVFGAGPIGLLTIVCLKLAGARRIWSVEPLAHRRELALCMGADDAIDPGAVDPARQILNDTRGRGADVAVDCATSGDTLNQSIHAARNGGRVVVTGIPSELRVPLEFSPMRRKELALYNVRRSNHESEPARDLLLAHVSRFAPMITHTRPLEAIAEAFALAASYCDGVGKLIVTPGGGGK